MPEESTVQFAVAKFNATRANPFADFGSNNVAPVSCGMGTYVHNVNHMFTGVDGLK
jgi:hypothetical protein